MCVWDGVTSWKNDCATLSYSSHTAAVSIGLQNGKKLLNMHSDVTVNTEI